MMMRPRGIDEQSDGGLQSDELYVRPDDQWEANDVAKLCADDVETLARVADDVSRQLIQNMPLARKVLPEGGGNWLIGDFAAAVVLLLAQRHSHARSGADGISTACKLLWLTGGVLATIRRPPPRRKSVDTAVFSSLHLLIPRRSLQDRRAHSLRYQAHAP